MWRIRHLTDMNPVRFPGRALLLLVIVFFLPAALAQPSAPMSPSVVLVLKLVSSTLVKPTTGIVVGNDGLVLVPAAFAGEDGEVIVLDGGTDIASNGRPAKLVEKAAAGELALLSVKGLKKPAIKFAGNFDQTRESLHLEAFPPAEEIARGASPLRVPVKALPGPQDGQFVNSAATPLPYVTGAILDACGYLAGVSLAHGPQSLDSTEATTVLLGGELEQTLDAMQLNLPAADCTLEERPAATPVESEEMPHAPPMATPSDKPVVPDDAPTLPDESAIAEPTVGAADETPSPETGSVQPEPQKTTRIAEPPSIWRQVPAWLWLLIVVAGGVVAWKAIYFFRLRPHPPRQTSGSERKLSVQPASDEPVTAPLEGSGVDSLKPRSAPVMDFELPDHAPRPEGCDALLLVEGSLDADTPFKRYCFVNSRRIDVVIGRGDADIAIEHATISRNHARIRSHGDRLTFSDLGSRNGSFIGEASCLSGEVIYLESDAELFLGDVKITIAVVIQEGEWA